MSNPNPQLPATCPDRDGTGFKYYKRPTTLTAADPEYQDACPTCHGTGKIQDTANPVSSEFHKAAEAPEHIGKLLGIDVISDPKAQDAPHLRDPLTSDPTPPEATLAGAVTNLPSEPDAELPPAHDKPQRPKLLAEELRYKPQMLGAITGTLTHYGDETTPGMLAESASQIACELIRSESQRAVEAELKEGQRLFEAVGDSNGAAYFVSRLAALEDYRNAKRI